MKSKWTQETVLRICGYVGITDLSAEKIKDCHNADLTIQVNQMQPLVELLKRADRKLQGHDDNMLSSDIDAALTKVKEK